MRSFDLASPYAALADGRVSLFTGVRNTRARNYLRDRMRPGDLALWYHSSPRVGPPGVAGIARVVAVVPDDDACNPKHPMYDAAHTAEAPRWFAARCEAVRPLARFLSLHELKAHAAAPQLADMLLFTIPRLSVQPVTAAAWAYIVGLEGATATASATASTSATSTGGGTSCGDSSGGGGGGVVSRGEAGVDGTSGDIAAAPPAKRSRRGADAAGTRVVDGGDRGSASAVEPAGVGVSSGSGSGSKRKRGARG